jgi:hypothetical protein
MSCLLSFADGYEPINCKICAGYSTEGPMLCQKRIANCRESAQADSQAHRHERSRMNDDPVDLDKHRGMAAQKATDMRRLLADVEANAKTLRERQGLVETEILAVPAASWAEAVAKARYVLNLYSTDLAASDTHHRDLVTAVLADFARLSDES